MERGRKAEMGKNWRGGRREGPIVPRAHHYLTLSSPLLVSAEARKRPAVRRREGR